MWSQYSDSQINTASAVLMFSAASWVAGHRVSGVVCFGPQRGGGGAGCCLKTECIIRLRVCVCVCILVDVCMFKSVRARVCVMQGGAGAEPDPCVFYLHLNEAREVIYPAFSPPPHHPHRPSLSLSQSNRHWSLCQARWPTVLFSSSKVSSLPFICTWERPWPHTPLPCSSRLHVGLTPPVCVWASTQSRHMCASVCVGLCMHAHMCECSSVCGSERVCVYQALCLCWSVRCV